MSLSHVRSFCGMLESCGLNLSATIAVFTFQGVWNDFYGPLIFLSTNSKFTLALGINAFKGLYNTQVPLMMAMSFLMVIPMIIVFFFAQKLMIRGVVLSGIKG